MIQELRKLQLGAGATLNEAGIPLSFGNDQVALGAAREGAALCDRSHWGRIRVTDSDRIRFLHNQSTNDFLQLQPGQGCDTVLITSTARTIDLVTAYVTEDAVLLLTSPGQCQFLMAFLDRYIFFADQVKLSDITDATAAFSLIGPASQALLERLGVPDLTNAPYASHHLVSLGNVEVRVAVGSGLTSPGYTLFVAVEHAPELWRQLLDVGAVPLGDRAWECLRIEQGRPMPGHELTEDYNPLEAGLWHTISFNKGCYIGQETIARLETYKGVKQQLWGIHLSAMVEPGSIITRDSEKLGRLTSITETEQGAVGLGYIRTRAGGPGLDVQVDDVVGQVIDVPFLTHDRQSN